MFFRFNINIKNKIKDILDNKLAILRNFIKLRFEKILYNCLFNLKIIKLVEI